MQITQTSILFTNYLTEINGQWSKNTEVGFWPVSTQLQRHSAAYISIFGTSIIHTPDEEITAKCPVQPQAKLSSNCLSNARNSNAGMAGSILGKTICTYTNGKEWKLRNLKNSSPSTWRNCRQIYDT